MTEKPDFPTVQLWIRANISMVKKAHGWTDAQIADRMVDGNKMTVASLRSCTGSRNIQLGALIRLAAALGVTPAQLLTEPENLEAALAISHRARRRKPLVTDWRKRPITKMAGIVDAPVDRGFSR